MSDVVIVGAKRTAIGSMLGQFTGVPTPTLGAAAIEGALGQGGVAADQIDEVIMGCVLPAGLGQAPARQAALKAGLPKSVQATTVNKVCGSGMQTVIMGAEALAVERPRRDVQTLALVEDVREPLDARRERRAGKPHGFRV